MTITVKGVADAFTGDGLTVAFVTTFVFGTSADIEVIERVIATGAETTKTLTTDYTVSGGGGSGASPAVGTITAGTAPASTVEWHVRRIRAATQATSLPTAGALPSAAVEEMSDIAMMVIQQSDEESGRGLRFPKTDSASLDPEIPNSVDRASKLLAFAADGTPVVRDISDGGTGTLSNLSEDTTPQYGAEMDTNGFAHNESEGTAVASAATTDIWATDGNNLHVTGNTGPITSFGTAPRVGAVRWITFDSTPTLTNSANLKLAGAADYTAAAGDIMRVYADTLTQFDCLIFKADGKAVIATTIPANDLEFVSTAAITVATTLEINGLAAGFDYIIQLEAFAVTDDSEVLWMRWSDDGVPTYEAGAADYSWGISDRGTASEDGSDAQIDLCLANGNDVGNFSSLTITMVNPMGTSEKTTAYWSGYTMNVNAVPGVVTGGGIFLQGTDNITDIQFLWAGGSTFKAQGDVSVWRRKRS